ncbi:jg15200 [Pararge aegeria aegeria]|uniref:Jg15200 protein n=1 Tax=Pararge aegeria aegeria TaxID=348720 RepID=A0A8S4QKN1_9NEOP|nr:jg15200 [Pararge aegeria aegeria]
MGSRIPEDSLIEYLNTLIQSAKLREVHSKSEVIFVKFFLKGMGAPRHTQANGDEPVMVCIIADRAHCREAVRFHVPHIYFNYEILNHLQPNTSLIEQLVESFDAFLVSDTILEPVTRSFGPELHEARKHLYALNHGVSMTKKVEELKLKIQEDFKREHFITVEIGHVLMTPKKLVHNLNLVLSYMLPEFKLNWQNVTMEYITTSTGPVIPTNWNI